MAVQGPRPSISEPGLMNFYLSKSWIFNLLHPFFPKIDVYNDFQSEKVLDLSELKLSVNGFPILYIVSVVVLSELKLKSMIGEVYS